jgi:hypothetical protein
MACPRWAASLAFLVLASCTGEPDPVPVEDLRRLVLQPADLPTGFRQFDWGRITRTDVPPGPRADPVRFDRVDGWKARYRRTGSATSAGPLVVESRADVFRSEDGAEQDLAAYRIQFQGDVRQGSGSGRLVAVPMIGEEVVAMTLVQEAVEPVRFYSVAWRQGSVTASVSVNGFDGRVSLEDAVRLARAQAGRITAVVSSS